MDQKKKQESMTIYQAASEGNVDRLKHLIEAGNIVNERNGWFQYTALHRASYFGHSHCVKVFCNFMTASWEMLNLF